MTRGGERGLWEPRGNVPLFFEVKGIAERILTRLGQPFEMRCGSSQPYLHPGAASQIVVGKQVVGDVGELHPEVASRFGIEVPCAALELDLSAVGRLPAAHPRYREVSRHPLVRRDLAVVVDRDQPAGEILEAIRKQAGSGLVSARVFDRYEGEGIAVGRVSLAFRLVFQRPDRTLTDAEVSTAVDSVVQMLARRFGGELR